MKGHKKFAKHVVALLSVLAVGCSDLNLSQISSATDLVTGLKNKTPDVSSIGKVDVATALKAGTELAKAATLSDSDMKQLCLQTANYKDKTNRLAPPSSPYTKRLQRITARHQSEDGLKLNYKVYLTKDVNAWALDDGTIRVFSGLMDFLADDQELLAVIAHEIGHVKNGHSKEAMRLKYVASAARTGLASMNNVAGVLANSTLVGGLAEEFVNAQFSQSDEREADDYSVKFLEKYNYDPYAAVRLQEKFAKLAEKHGQAAEGFQFLSTHPAAGERAKRLAANLQERGISPKGGIAIAKAEKAADTAAQPDASQTADKPVQLAKVDTTAAVKATTSDATVSIGDGPAVAHKTASIQLAPESETSAAATTLPAANYGRTSVSIIDHVARGYYVQLTAKTEKELAQAKSGELSSHGLRTHTQEAIVNGVHYFRVLVGPYKSRSTALAKESEIKTANLADEEPFIQNLN